MDGASEEEQASTQTESSKDLSSLLAILDGRYFEISIKKMDGNKFLSKCKLCPSKLISAQMNATSNLLKHLKVNEHQ